MCYEEEELAYEVKTLLLGLINLAGTSYGLKGGVIFKGGDAREIKRRIIKVNNWLPPDSKVKITAWPHVVIPDSKDELHRLMPKLTKGQQNRIVQCYGYVDQMTSCSTIAKATNAALKATAANKRAEQEILASHLALA